MGKHRLDALTDGIFAVAMTLLVIELKLPEPGHLAGNLELLAALVRLIPKLVGWIISFFVLAMFWYGHSRAFDFVKRVDGRLVALTILMLAGVSFMPFASALAGELPKSLGGQVVYSLTMAVLATTAWLTWRHIYHHPELCGTPMPKGTYRESRFRTVTLIVISVVAVGLTDVLPGAGNAAFMLMIPVGQIGRRIRERAEREG